jgi:hypothetical protein
MDKRTSIVALIIGIIISIILGITLTAIRLPPSNAPAPPPREVEAPFLTLKVVVSFVNITIILPLLYTYTKLYLETKTEFTLSLITVIMVLFIYAVTSNPLLHIIFGFYVVGLGPFAILPDICATIALLVLFHLSLE